MDIKELLQGFDCVADALNHASSDRSYLWEAVNNLHSITNRALHDIIDRLELDSDVSKSTNQGLKLQDRINRLQANVATLTKERDGALKHVANLKAEAIERQAENDRLRGKNTRLEQQYESARTCSACARMKELATELERVKVELNTARETIKSTADYCKNSCSILAEARADVKRAEEQNRRGDWKALNKLLDGRDSSSQWTVDCAVSLIRKIDSDLTELKAQLKEAQHARPK